RNPFGGLEVFASAGASESTPSSLWHIWQWTGGVWSGWASLGGGVIGTPAIARRRLVRLEFSRREKSIFPRLYREIPMAVWKSSPTGWTARPVPCGTFGRRRLPAVGPAGNLSAVDSPGDPS